jgi:O-antigen ligase
MLTQVGQLFVFIFSGCLFLVAASHLQDMRWLKTITFLFIGIGLIPLLPRLVPSSIFSSWGFLPESVVAGSMFWTWLVALSFGQAIMNRELRPLGRLALIIVAFAAIALGLNQPGWISGWGPPLVAVFVILFLRFPMPVLATSPLIITVAVLSKTLFWDVMATGDNLYSLSTREAAAKSLLPILEANPVLGLGPANYYHYTMLNPILGWYVKFNSHNNYLDLIAQIGLVGLACFLWFAWAVGKTAWNMRLKATSGFEQGYICSVFAGLIATLAAAYLGDWVIPFVYNTGFAGFRTSILPWIFMGGLVAIEQRWIRKAQGFQSS